MGNIVGILCNLLGNDLENGAGYWESFRDSFCCFGRQEREEDFILPAMTGANRIQRNRGFMRRTRSLFRFSRRRFFATVCAAMVIFTLAAGTGAIIKHITAGRSDKDDKVDDKTKVEELTQQEVEHIAKTAKATTEKNTFREMLERLKPNKDRKGDLVFKNRMTDVNVHNKKKHRGEKRREKLEKSRRNNDMESTGVVEKFKRIFNRNKTTDNDFSFENDILKVNIIPNVTNITQQASDTHLTIENELKGRYKKSIDTKEINNEIFVINNVSKIGEAAATATIEDKKIMDAKHFGAIKKDIEDKKVTDAKRFGATKKDIEDKRIADAKRFGAIKKDIVVKRQPTKKRSIINYPMEHGLFRRESRKQMKHYEDQQGHYRAIHGEFSNKYLLTGTPSQILKNKMTKKVDFNLENSRGLQNEAGLEYKDRYRLTNAEECVNNLSNVIREDDEENKDMYDDEIIKALKQLDDVINSFEKENEKRESKRKAKLMMLS